jgi:hypothetical protein
MDLFLKIKMLPLNVGAFRKSDNILGRKPQLPAALESPPGYRFLGVAGKSFVMKEKSACQNETP